ncbi:tetratricopeptide repeat protein [Candidatus Poribacteria bacterium]|nr:tetratricopeptide repeat protein [Candidatus Poribacteria bacterium]
MKSDKTLMYHASRITYHVSRFTPAFIYKMNLYVISKIIKFYFRLFIILPVMVSFCACGASVQQSLVIWAEDDQILLDVGSDSGIGVGDKASIYRETRLTHPANGEDLGMLKENLTDVSIIAVRKNSVTARLVEDTLRPVPSIIQPGDKAVITKQKGEIPSFPPHTDGEISSSPPFSKGGRGDFVTQIGSVTFVEPQSQNIEIALQNPTEIFLSATLTVAMPLRIIQHPVSGQKIALLMQKIADVEVISVDSASNTANCRITESPLSPLFQRGVGGISPEIGDPVVKLSETSISSWFQEIDESSEEMIYQRAYRQALRHYESAEYWQVIRNLQTIEALNIEFEDTLYLLAASYKHLGMYDKAQNYFERAVRQKPEDAKIWLELAYMYLDQNRLKEAADAYQQLTKLLPDNYQLWIDLSNIYSRMGDQTKSNAAYQKATQLEPDR